MLCVCFSAQSYCVPGFVGGCTLGDQINSFSIPSANFNHQNTGCSSNAYGNFTSQTINLSAGVNYNFTITHGFNDQHVKIWIDFNNDGTFANTSPELVASAISATQGTLDVTSDVITIPSTVAPGTYRMRVADLYDEDPVPCNSDGYGEAHDYTVTISAAPSCLVPSGLAVSNITSSSATLSWDSPSNAPAVGYEYYLSTSSTTPGLSAQATGSVSAGILTASLSVSSFSVYYVWVRSVCSVNSKSVWSASATFSTPCLSITPTYTNNFTVFPGACWSQASGGNSNVGSSGSDIYWNEGGFLNSDYTGAAKINLYSQNRAGWLKTPVFNLSAGGYRVKFNYGITDFGNANSSPMGTDDVIQFLISNNGGNTWSVLQTWNTSNEPSNISNLYSLDLTNYNSSNTVFAIYATDGAVIDPEDYEFFVDNFVVESTGNLNVADSVKNQNEISVYPNPFTDVLYIKNSEKVQSASVSDFNGRIIKRFDNVDSALRMGGLTSGAYLLVLKMKDGSQQTQKIIKK